MGPLATRFAEACLRRFLAGERLGEAGRPARLDLLACGDPLALAYVAHAMPALQAVGAARPARPPAATATPSGGR